MTPHGFGRRCMYFDYIDYVLRFGAISMPMRLGQCCQRLTGFTGPSGKKIRPLGKTTIPRNVHTLVHLVIITTSCLRIYVKIIYLLETNRTNLYKCFKNRPLIFVLPFFGLCGRTFGQLATLTLGLSVSTRLFY